MILAHFEKKVKAVKGKVLVAEMFSAADKDGDDELNLEEFKAFCGLMNGKLKEKHGGAYELTDA